MRIEKQKRQKAESIKESKKEVKDQAEARQKIALWVVQHYEGAEPIKTIEVGKIKTHGILGAGGSSVSIVINSKKKNMIEGIGVNEQGNPTSAGFSFFKGLASVLPKYDIYVWIAKPTQEIQDICDNHGSADVNGGNILTGNNAEDSFRKIIWALQQMAS